MEILRRSSRYAPAVSLATRLIDEATDPALRELARERLVAMLEHDDWNEDQRLDDDFAAHVQPPWLADRPWALSVARRVLARVGCRAPRAALTASLRARFGVDVEEEIDRIAVEGPSGDFDPTLFRLHVRRLPLGACAPEPQSALGYVRAHMDGSVDSASTSPCLDATLDTLTQFSPGPVGGDADARFVFVFVSAL